MTTASLSVPLKRAIPMKRLSLFLLGFYTIALSCSMSLMEIGAGSLFLLFLIDGSLKETVKTPLFTPMLLFIGVVCLGILWGDSTLQQKVYDFGRMRFFLFFFVLYSLLVRTGENRKWLSALRIAVSVIGIYGFVQHFVAIDLIRPEGKKVLLYALQDEKIGPLVVGAFNHHLTFSNSYLFFSCLFFALGLSDIKRRPYDLGLGAFLFLLVFWTQSRVAWVAIPICLVILSVFVLGRRALAVSCVAAIAIPAALYFTNPSFQSRIATTVNTADHRSFLPRLNLWKSQIDMWREHPLLGIGWNNNERHAKQYVDRYDSKHLDPFYGHAHSMPLQILATTGVAGLSLFLLIWGGVFRLCYQVIRRSSGETKAIGIGAFASFVGFWIQGLTQWNFGDAEVLHTVIFFWALVAALSTFANAKSTA